MPRIIELNDSPLRAVINDQGKITQIVDEHGNDMGIFTFGIDPVTGGIEKHKISLAGKVIAEVFTEPSGAVLQSSLHAKSRALGGYGIATSTGYYTGYTKYNFRMRSVVGGEDIINPVLTYNSYIIFSAAGYTVAPNGFEVKASVEYNGKSYPVTFSGSRFLSLSASNPVVDSDEVQGLVLPANSEFYVRTFVVVASTAYKIPTGRLRYPDTNTIEQAVLGGGNDLSDGTGAMTAAGAGSGASLNAYTYGPVSVSSKSPAATSKAFAIMGDSIPDGTGYDTVPDADGGYGWAVRALNACGLAGIKLCRGTNTAQWSTPQQAPGQWRNCERAKYLIWALGTNDIRNGRSYSQLIGDTQVAFDRARSMGMTIIAYKILPRTDASNIPYSTAFDPAGTNVRGQYNDWLDAQLAAGKIDYVRSFNAICESGTTGTWSSYATQTGDGTHPLPALYNSMVAQESAFYGSLTA